MAAASPSHNNPQPTAVPPSPSDDGGDDAAFDTADDDNDDGLDAPDTSDDEQPVRPPPAKRARTSTGCDDSVKINVQAVVSKALNGAVDCAVEVPLPTIRALITASESFIAGVVVMALRSTCETVPEDAASVTIKAHAVTEAYRRLSKVFAKEANK